MTMTMITTAVTITTITITTITTTITITTIMTMGHEHPPLQKHSTLPPGTTTPTTMLQ